MPEVKNTFLKSKMNKDLDARILPNGEYRDAENVNISKSEGDDVGLLENVLSNTLTSTIKTLISNIEFDKINDPSGFDSILKALNSLEIIGKFMDVKNNKMFLMLTNYVDTSPDRISNFAPSDLILPGIPTNTLVYKGACCYICEFDLNNDTATILVGGNFLNFSKTHKILGINLLEDLLFWTDDRNQPRKINVRRARNQPFSDSTPYYQNEDHVSVAKFAPVLPISLIEKTGATVWESTMQSVTQQYLPIHLIDTVRTSAGSGGSILAFERSFTSGTSDSMLQGGDKVIIENSDGEEFEYIINYPGTTPSNAISIVGTFADGGLASGVSVGWTIKVQRPNPFYDAGYVGDKNVLKDRFVRFSYRFKFDDNEYSLFAPFTQEIFIPKQFGYFVDTNEDKAGKSGIVSFMENLIDKVKFNIRLPYSGNTIGDELKITEIQIVSKASNEQAVKVIEDVLVSDLPISQDYIYEYNSIKPYKTLPEKDLTRVHDKIPIRAKCQEVTSNRVLYGNFIDKHTSPDFLNYENNVNIKNINNHLPTAFSQIRREYPNHTLKQNRSYTSGVVLMDRYGRSSNVILSQQTNASSFKVPTVYSPYRNFGVSDIESWPGDVLDIIFNEPISDTGPNGYPGLYSSTNPLGWYSYKVVVKQQEQEYYNVYLPGILAGEISWNTKPIEYDPDATPIVEPAQDETAQNQPNYISSTNTSLISLFGDNINKIPRNLNDVGATDIDFGSSVKLFNRVNPSSWISIIFDSSGIFGEGVPYNVQSSVNNTPDTVDFIKPFKQLGEWTTTKGNLYPGQQFNQESLPFKDPWYPFTGVINTDNDASGLQFKDPLFKSNENPFIASISTQFKTGVKPKKYIAPSTDYEFYRNTGSTRLGDTTLGVYETNPTESLLELFWETSTAGLINSDSYISGSDQYDGLNNMIEAGLLNPAPAALSETNFILNEADVSGSDALSSEFELLDSNGNPCADSANTITILSVKDGFNNERSKDFDISQSPVDLTKWMIVSNWTFVYNQDASVRENYTFYLDCQAFGYNTTLSFQGSLVNTPPQNISIPTTPANPPSIPYPTIIPSFAFLSTTSSTKTIISSGDFKNGSVMGSRDQEQLIYEVSFVDSLTGADYSDYFSYSNNLGDLQVTSVQGAPYITALGAYFPITVKDANGNGGSYNLMFNVFIG